MPSHIHLLPERTANQIAAGEVVQRPASVVKELMENAIDAGATTVKLYIKNGGCTFIQVDDNGCGMNETDAVMCWERHATSKITKAEDLYNLNTLGFRGEALASIASVSEVEMKTRSEEDESGTLIRIHAGELLEQNPVGHTTGTSIAVKNLFYNIPARKNFLKSITVETKHIFEEFQRITLAYPEVGFEFYNHEKVVSKLGPSNLKTRISDLLGVKASELITSEEETDIVSISGFVGSPKIAKRSRGNQFLFANGRYIRDPYFNHAIRNAYHALIEEQQYPFYVLFLKVDPSKIDVNIHPTKHEVKLEDGRHVYSLLNSTVKKSLSQCYTIPEMDELKPTALGERDPRAFNVSAPDRRYNPFQPSREKIKTEWEKLDELLRSDPEPGMEQTQLFVPESKEELDVGSLFQLADKYIVFKQDSDLWLVNQYRAHEQVLYEQYHQLFHQGTSTQQLLFPRTLELSAADFNLFLDLQAEIQQLGFDLSEFGKNTLIVNGLPAELSKEDGAEVISQILDDYKMSLQTLKSDKKEALIRATAKNAAIKAGKKLEDKEMRQLVSDLLHCKQNNVNPNGLPIVIKFNPNHLERLFK